MTEATPDDTTELLPSEYTEEDFKELYDFEASLGKVVEDDVPGE